MRVPNPESILFIDIETVPEYERFHHLPLATQELWAQKVHYQISEDKSAEDLYNEKAGVMAEFSKIVCASVAYLSLSGSGYSIKIKSFYGDDEAAILSDLSPVLSTIGKGNLNFLCAHNGLEFDYPFLARRYLIKQIELPECLDLAGKKPWEIPHLDTMVLWKFGDRKAYTSLNLLSHIFGIPSPKDDISGAEVKGVYYQEKDCLRIAKYCEKDVLTLAKVYLKFCVSPLNINEISSELP